MLKYTCDKEFPKVLQSKVQNIFFADFIINAIKNKNVINYNDELPRYVINDMGIDEEKLVFFFSDGITKEILYNQIIIKQSSSIPYEFYLEDKNSKDYIVIIFSNKK